MSPEQQNITAGDIAKLDDILGPSVDLVEDARATLSNAEKKLSSIDPEILKAFMAHRHEQRRQQTALAATTKRIRAALSEVPEDQRELVLQGALA